MNLNLPNISGIMSWILFFVLIAVILFIILIVIFRPRSKITNAISELNSAIGKKDIDECLALITRVNTMSGRNSSLFKKKIMELNISEAKAKHFISESKLSLSHALAILDNCIKTQDFSGWTGSVNQAESIISFSKLVFETERNKLAILKTSYDSLKKKHILISEQIEALKNADTLGNKMKIIHLIEAKKKGIIYDWAEYDSIKKSIDARVQDERDNFSKILYDAGNAFEEGKLDECDLKISRIDEMLKESPWLIATKYNEKFLYELKEKAGNRRAELEEAQKRLDAMNKAREVIENFDRFIKTGNVQALQAKINVLNRIYDRYPGSLGQDDVERINIRWQEVEDTYAGYGLTVANIGTPYVEYDTTRAPWQKNPYSWEYPGVFYPKKGCIVFPYRRRKAFRRGFLEEYFQNYLERYFSSYQVIGDASIHLADGCRPYEPDIAIVDTRSGLNIRIDVEIDEPYAGVSRKAIHFIGCGDESRDDKLTKAGWIVMRFAEVDIKKRTSECIHRIVKVISSIDSNAKFEALPPFDGQFYKRQRWTRTEAEIMASKNEREKYLGIDGFGIIPDEELANIDISLTEEERRWSALLEKSIPMKPSNLDGSVISFPNDSRLVFNPEDHTYYYDGYRKLMPISNLVHTMFNEFDSVGTAIRLAQKNGKSPEYYLKEWDKKGARAREVGTFMHRQIEHSLQGEVTENIYLFKYPDDPIENIDISMELAYFFKFKNDKHIVPFRSEWSICDLKHGIAGTIDCLCKNPDGTYDIFDWKRSEKIVDFNGSPITRDPYGKTANSPFEHLSDCSYIHYTLQQNLYRYILETNYRIRIKNMYLVVLSNAYSTYYQLQMPKMDEDVRNILAIKKRVE